MLFRSQEKEPKVWEWLASLQDRDLKSINKGGGLFDEHPTISMAMTALLMKYFIKGYVLAEHKWKINLEDKPRLEESGDYYPSLEDFK